MLVVKRGWEPEDSGGLLVRWCLDDQRRVGNEEESGEEGDDTEAGCY